MDLRHNILVFFLLFIPSVTLAAPSAEMLANPCAGCHGFQGSSVGPASPSIASLPAEYFIELMQEFKKGTRPNTIMSRIAKGYSDAEIKLLASYFAKQKLQRFPQKTDKKLAARGKVLHNKYCDKCHPKGGRSVEDDAGFLAGQWAPYLRHSMQDYYDGSRPMPKKMKKKLDNLRKEAGDKGLEQLIHYYASQK